MRFYGARQAIIAASDSGQLTPATDYKYFDTDPEPPRLYCPSCSTHGNCYETGRDKRDEKWGCRSCESLFRRPSMLTCRGKMNAKQSAGGKDNDWRIVDGMDAGRIMSLVGKLPHDKVPVRAWCMFCNTREFTWFDIDDVADYVYSELKKIGLLPQISRDTATHNDVVRALMDDLKAGYSNGTGLYTDSHLARMVGVNRMEFHASRTWGRFKSVVIAAIDDLDKSALGPIAEYLTVLEKIEEVEDNLVNQRPGVCL